MPKNLSIRSKLLGAFGMVIVLVLLNGAANGTRRAPG